MILSVSDSDAVEIRYMKTPIKRVRKEKVAIPHVCAEQKTFDQLVKTTDKMSMIIIGNGNPKEGYVYKVDEMGRDIKDINEKLTGISGVVKELHEESVGVKAIVKTLKEKRAEFLKVAMFVIALAAVLFTAYNSVRSVEKQDVIIKNQDDQSIPFVVNKRGEFIKLPDSTQIIFYNNDSARYLIKRDK